MRNQLAVFFPLQGTNNPQLTFDVNNSQVLNNICNSLWLVTGANLGSWQAELASTTTTAGNGALDTALQNARGESYAVAENLLNTALAALADEVNLCRIDRCNLQDHRPRQDSPR